MQGYLSCTCIQGSQLLQTYCNHLKTSLEVYQGVRSFSNLAQAQLPLTVITVALFTLEPCETNANWHCTVTHGQ